MISNQILISCKKQKKSIQEKEEDWESVNLTQKNYKNKFLFEICKLLSD